MCVDDAIARQVESKQVIYVPNNILLGNHSASWSSKSSSLYLPQFAHANKELRPSPVTYKTMLQIPKTRPKSPKLGRKKESPTAEMEVNGANTFQPSISRLGQLTGAK
nr:hypothetical protein [Tanacetum cinerariifolium]